MPAPTPPVEIVTSTHFPEWLYRLNVSLAVTTYQTHRLFLLGLKPDGTLSGFERLFERAMGIHATTQRLTLATKYQIRTLVNVLTDGQTHDGYDRLYVPRTAHTTGELDLHDLHASDAGEVLFVNTAYSCLATLDPVHSFRPIWQPPFISRLLPEDRCHLNGLAMQDGRPRYVTAVSRSDVAAGWRDRRADGGVVLDVPSNEVVAHGLSMPHSPRWYQDRLWLINAGTGELGTVALDTGRFEPVAFVPGFGRGLTFIDGYAIVGLSKPRRERAFQGLALDAALHRKDAAPYCGLAVIELATGRTAHWLRFEGVVEELYDVQVLPGVRRPMALGFKTNEIRRMISFLEDDPQPTRHALLLEADDEEAASIYSLPALPQTAPVAATPARSVRQAARTPLTFVAGTLPAREIRRFERLLGPSFRSYLAHQADPDLPLTGILAQWGETPVGLAVAYQDPQHGGAELASLYVEPVHRHQGIGRRLLEHLEAQVTRQGFPFIQVRYRSTIPQIDAFEHLLERRAWGPATVSQHMFKAPLEDVLTAPWIDRYPLPAAAAPVAWTDLTPEEAAAIKRRKGQPEPEGYPAALDPFQLAHLPWQPYSLGLRTPDGVAGWMMAHRLSESLVQYTSLWIHPSLRGSGASVYLVGEALKRQQREGQAPDCLWRVDADNAAMLRFTRRRLSPYLSHAAETLLRGKSLQAPTSHII